MSNANPFSPAVKEQLKARIALSGPSGGGKTFTALRMATTLAEGGKIAVVDTERRSASLYADLFKFDALDFQPPYVPQRLIDHLRAAEANGYAVVIIDSGTHFWNGPGGILEIVDKNAKGGNTWSGWAVGTPIQQAMIDTMTSVNLHVIMCMRSKQEWALQENANGKKEPVRLGMAPQQRGDIEYEFTVFGELDLNHCLTVSKTRCPLLAGLVDVNPGEQFAETLLAWLSDGADPDDSYRELGWSGRSDHEDRRDRLVERVRGLTVDARQAFTEARSHAGLSLLSAPGATFSVADLDAMGALVDKYEAVSATEPPPAATESENQASGAAPVPDAAENPSRGAGGVDARSAAATAHVRTLDAAALLAELNRRDLTAPRDRDGQRMVLVAALAEDPGWAPDAGTLA